MVANGYGPAIGVVSALANMTRLANSVLDGSAPGVASIRPIEHTIPNIPTRPGQVSGMLWAIDSQAGTAGTMVWHNGLNRDESPSR
ncbi:hypothetical protein AOC05_08650 [Arthrobacter alpinus]|uniref:Uncharacterized protein n=1 Tax=Arthrobacter alpinus TaxID=656366 RepID=A0A0M4RNS9_9MICC|nr:MULTISPECIES: hypothetical protein [Arthrobacter]ALE92371.1 hypothetical protein AOC05_08650 [Arthrobacter alpinus]